MSNKKFILEDADHFITLNQDGKIVIETIFEKKFDGDLELLFSCIADNIMPDDEGNGEHIDWSMVYSDYNTIIEVNNGN